MTRPEAIAEMKRRRDRAIALRRTRQECWREQYEWAFREDIPQMEREIAFWQTLSELIEGGEWR